MQEVQELYRGALYDPSRADAQTVKPDPRLTEPFYRDKNGYPIMFPGAAKLRQAMRAERHKACGNAVDLTKKPQRRRNKVILVPIGAEAKSEQYRIIDDAVRDLGFQSYDEYLRSDLWNRIQQAVFDKKGTSCCLCTEKAVAVHHHSYAPSVMSGDNLEPLFPICDRCHKSLEFEHGKKRSLHAVQSVFRDKLRRWCLRNGMEESLSRVVVKSKGCNKPKKIKQKKKKKDNPITVVQARGILSDRDFSEKPVNVKTKSTKNKPKKADAGIPASDPKRLEVLAKFQSKMKGSSLMKPDAVRANG